MGYSYIMVPDGLHGHKGDLKQKLGDDKVPRWLCMARAGQRNRCGNRASSLWETQRARAAHQSRGSDRDAPVTLNVKENRAPKSVRRAMASADIDPVRVTGFSRASFSGWAVEATVAGGGRVTDVVLNMEVRH